MSNRIGGRVLLRRHRAPSSQLLRSADDAQTVEECRKRNRGKILEAADKGGACRGAISRSGILYRSITRCRCGKPMLGTVRRAFGVGCHPSRRRMKYGVQFRRYAGLTKYALVRRFRRLDKSALHRMAQPFQLSSFRQDRPLPRYLPIKKRQSLRNCPEIL
jgi:hypothetical protein